MMLVKFIFDRLAALLALVLLSPLFVVIALLLRILNEDGKVIFSQKRVGRNGDLFDIYKFCTMSGSSKGSSITVGGDKRITPLGAKLRRYKLDELPQLWNVLIGEMSFVGPRPDVPGYVDKLQGEARNILLLRPGITGPASLKYRNEEDLLADVDEPEKYNDEIIFPDKVRLNLIYYHHFSIGLDFKIIFATLTGKKIFYYGEYV